MQVSCDCLNISISSNATSFYSKDTSFRVLFPMDNFFNEDVEILCSCSVTIQVPNLIKEKDTGLWKVITCINCGQACYATNRNMDNESLVVKRNLEKEASQISAIMKNDNYSPIFKILIYNNDLVLENNSDLKTQLYPAALTWLSEQTSKTEERIKTYTEKEYAALDELRKRAYKDQLAIIRREKDYINEKQKPSFVEELSVSERITSIKKSDDNVLHDSSLDTEGVFLFEEFDNTNKDKQGNYDSDSSEANDDIENEVSVSRKTTILSSQLARSLPIPVPQFLEDKKKINHQSGDSPQVPSDIAASIRALAKSVHGDAIFGELPRPRFSTNI